MQPFTARRRHRGPQGLAHQLRQGVQAVRRVQHHVDLVPAHHVQRHEGGVQLAADHAHQFAALGAGFPGVAPLQIAGIHHPRLVTHHLAGVHMAQRPVVVALAAQRVQRSGRVGVVAFGAGQAGVQQADVEVARHRHRVARHQVFRHLPVGEAVAVDGHAQVVELHGLGRAAGKHLDIVGPGQLA